MQDLIVGERYHVKHRDGNWEGNVTFTGYQGELICVKDIEMTGWKDAWIEKYYEKKGWKSKLGGGAEWWGFELVNFSLENE